MSRFDTLDQYRELSGKVTTFEITEEHLLLLRNAYVDWNDMEFGSPSIEPKRPYGNSDVLRDIAELLNPSMVGWDPDRIEEYTEKHFDRLTRLHVETGIALEICLRRAEFKSGWYRKVRWNEWERFGDSTAAPSLSVSSGEAESQ